MRKIIKDELSKVPPEKEKKNDKTNDDAKSDFEFSS
jgi:hypothetical protein